MLPARGQGNSGAGPLDRLRAHVSGTSVRSRVVSGFALLILVLAGVTAGATWQELVHHTDLAELQAHSSEASLLQNAEAQASIAGLLLQRYVAAGDESYVPEISTHAATAQQSLTEALSNGGPAGLDDVTAIGAQLVQQAARASALRHTGDLAGASAVLEETVPIFHDYRLKLEGLAAQELQQVAQSRERADRAGELAFWLLVLSGTLGTILALGASIQISRSIIKPLASLEETAARVSEGDFSARAPASGPKELAHMGSALNHMMEAIEQRNDDLREANSRLRDRNQELVDAQAQAATDPLTGLGNHRSFHKRLREEVTAAEASSSSLGLLVIDVDGFKAINDSLGHLAGDQVLRDIASTMAGVVQKENTYRYGGDELTVVLPGKDRSRATEIAEQLRSAISGMAAPDQRQITISVGVACFPETAASAEELIYLADMAMYWAKSTGKNRVSDCNSFISGIRAGVDFRHISPGGTRSSDAVASLCVALAAKDTVTRDHGERCSLYTADLARELQLDERKVSMLALASLLHDIGKLATPDHILRKPGPLDPDEMEQMRRHPTDGANMLTQVDAAAEAIPAIRHHHEHFDGSGYPDGLAGDQIPLASRILLVSDAFDAMTSDRPYRKAMPIEAALRELLTHSGRQFDPKVVEAFVRVISRRLPPSAADQPDYVAGVLK